MLKVNNVSFTYGHGKQALNNLSLNGGQGEFLLVLGHNGAGKSTFLKLLNGILKPTEGTITVNSKDTRTEFTSTLAQEIAVTFQNPRDQIFASTVEEEVTFGPQILQRPNANSLVQSALELFGLTKDRSLHPYDLPLSGQKLLTTASAAASGCSILAFDEPSAGLSVPERRTLLAGLTSVREYKLLIVISHDLDLFLPFASRVLVFYQGSLVLDTQPSVILQQQQLLRKASLTLPLSIRLRNALLSASS